MLQNYTDSVNPHKTVGDIIAEPLRIAGLNAGIPQKTAVMLSKVGLPEDFAKRFPHELSGGELQRVCIARALAPAPRFIILMKRFPGSMSHCSRTSCGSFAALKPLSQPGSLSLTIWQPFGQSAPMPSCSRMAALRFRSIPGQSTRLRIRSSDGLPHFLKKNPACGRTHTERQTMISEQLTEKLP